jgi:hypothetical protein
MDADDLAARVKRLDALARGLAKELAEVHADTLTVLLYRERRGYPEALHRSGPGSRTPGSSWPGRCGGRKGRCPEGWRALGRYAQPAQPSRWAWTALRSAFRDRARLERPVLTACGGGTK